MIVLADRYELAEELGAGRMARVVAARDRHLDRRIAIKLHHATGPDGLMVGRLEGFERLPGVRTRLPLGDPWVIPG